MPPEQKIKCNLRYLVVVDPALPVRTVPDTKGGSWNQRMVGVFGLLG